MRPVDVSPLIEHRHDLVGFGRGETMHRIPTRHPIIKTMGMYPSLPTLDAAL